MAATDKTSDELLVYLPLGADRVLVGRLGKEDDQYVFRYSDEFARQHEVPTLPDFPVPDRTYRSPELWPFFQARLPAHDRPEVQQIMRERGIAPENTLEVLAKMGRRAISSPYELELAHAK